MSQSSDDVLVSPTKVRFLVLAWLSGLASLAYVTRNCIGILDTPIQKALHISVADLGMIKSAFFIGYAFFQIPCGWLGARLGSRRALPLFICLWSAAIGSMALATGLTGLCIAQLVGGIAQAGLFPCCVNTISKWFPGTEKAFPNGVLASFMSVGSVLAVLLSTLLLYGLVWWQILLCYSLPGFICAFWFYRWFRDYPDEHSWVNKEELAHIESDQSSKALQSKQVTGAAVSSPWLPMVRNYRTWLICGQQVFRAAGLGFFFSWFPKFLQNVHKLDVKQSGFLGTVPLVGVIIGASLGGFLMDWTFRRTNNRRWSRQGVAVISLTTCSLLAAGAYFVAGPYLMTGLLGLAIICAGIGGPAGYTITIDLGGRHVPALFSTMNMMGNLGAAAIAYVVPMVAQSQGWNATLWLVAGLHFLAAVCWAVLSPEGTIFPDSEENPSSPSRDGYDQETSSPDTYRIKKRGS